MAHAPDFDPANRRLYLLSLWREAAGTPWRAALRSSASQERIAFADVEALALFLLRMADDGAPTELGEDGRPAAP